MVMRVQFTGGGFSLVHHCAENAEIWALHKAFRAMTRMGGDERSARGLSLSAALSPAVSTADLAISWYASFCGAARPAGEAVKTGNVGKWHSSNFRKVVRGDQRTAHLGRSTFRLTCEGKVFEQAAAMSL
jgi:hypothetical protein